MTGGAFKLKPDRYALTFDVVQPNVEALFGSREAVWRFHEWTGMVAGQEFDAAEQVGRLVLGGVPSPLQTQ